MTGTLPCRRRSLSWVRPPRRRERYWSLGAVRRRGCLKGYDERTVNHNDAQRQTGVLEERLENVLSELRWLQRERANHQPPRPPSLPLVLRAKWAIGAPLGMLARRSP